MTSSPTLSPLVWPSLFDRRGRVQRPDTERARDDERNGYVIEPQFADSFVRSAPQFFFFFFFSFLLAFAVLFLVAAT